MSTRHGGLTGAPIFSFVLGVSTIILVATCTSAAASGQSRRVAAGSWGGMGIGMVITGTGARIEYDCAHGTISEPLRLGADGRFDVRGLHFPEHGGPVREGEEPRGRPVRYTGHVTGENMTLTVRHEESDTPAGSYKLVRGKTGRIRKCL
jgi:hypothetical protein